MELEPIQQRFELALEEFEQKSAKIGLPQKNIKCNDYGVFINFHGVEVNYSLYSLEHELEDYLSQQAEQHERYKRLLQDHKSQTKKKLKRMNSSVAALVQRFSKPSKKELESLIGLMMAKVAFDKVIKEGALLGRFFFEEIVSDYTKAEFDEQRKKVVNVTGIIYENAKELEAIDIDSLQYFRNKELLWYGAKG
ncbi:MAG: hypothetical protein AABX31_00675 [Nanoarchaeota archaeon]